MMICQVVGHVWATKKEEGLNGHKLMIVREVTTNRRNGATFVAGGWGGGGVGGVWRRTGIGSDGSPIDSAIVGIIDSLEIAKDKGE